MKKIYTLCLLLLCTKFLCATIWQVDSLNSTGYGSIKAAYDSASNGDTIRFNPSLIANGSDTIFPSSFLWGKDISIVGLYNVTDTLFFSGNNIQRVFRFSNLDSVILDSVVIIDGFSSDNGGGANFWNVDSVAIMNSAFRGNESSANGIYQEGGGALYLKGGKLLLSNSVFKNNVSQHNGGCIFIRPNSSYLEMRNCEFWDNTGVDCGGVFYYGNVNPFWGYPILVNELKIDSCLFERNLSNVCDVGRFESALIEAKVSNSNFLNNSYDFAQSNSFGAFSGLIALNSKGGLGSITDMEVEMTHCDFHNNVDDSVSQSQHAFPKYVLSVENNNKLNMVVDDVVMENNYGGFAVTTANSVTTSFHQQQINISNVSANKLCAGAFLRGYLDTYGVNEFNLFDVQLDSNMKGGIWLDSPDDISLNTFNYQVSNSYRPLDLIAEKSTLNIQRSRFISNINFFGGVLKTHGGAMYLNADVLEVNLQDSCEFMANEASYKGGAIFIKADSLVFNSTSTVFDNNNVGSIFDSINLFPDGSSIYIDFEDSAYITFDSSVITNHVDTVGGIEVVLFHNQGGVFDLKMKNCFVNNNFQTDVFRLQANTGGLKRFKYLLENSTFHNNGMPIGFAVSSTIQKNTLGDSVVNCTFWDNTQVPFNSYSDSLWLLNNTFINTVVSASADTSNSSFALLKGNVFYKDSLYPIISYLYPQSAHEVISMGYNAFYDNSQPASFYDSTDLTNVSWAQVNIDSLGYNGGFVPTSPPMQPSILINSGDATDVSDAQNGPISQIRDIGAAESCYEHIFDNHIVLNGSSFFWALDSNTYYNSTDQPYVIFTNQNGCDSIVNLKLVFANDTATSDTVVSCGSYTWANSQIYNSSQVVMDTFQTVYGLDSIVTLNLTIAQPSVVYDTVVACNSYSWIDGNTYTFSDSITYVTTNSFGCDSIINLELFVNYDTNVMVANTVCDSFVWVNGHTYYGTQTVVDTFNSINGCDSIVTLNLTVNSSITDSLSQSACDSFTWTNGQTYYSSQILVDSNQTMNGCDSVVVVDLLVVNSVVDTAYQVSCDSFLWDNGEVYYSSQIVVDTFQTILGCDSVVSLDLTINNSSIFNISATVCDSFTWTNGQTYYSSQILVDSNQTMTGCDSVVVLDLVVNNSIFDTIYQISCDSFLWDNGLVYYNSQIVVDTFQTILGCDSVVSLDLTINNSSIFNTSVTVCDSFTWANGQTYYSSQTVSYVYQSIQGCDSLVFLDLTVHSVDTSVVQLGNILEAQSNNATYQWLDCSSNLPITNEIQSVFAPDSSGVYAVEVTENGCVDTSACYMVNIMGINDLNKSANVEVYPNPSSGVFNLVLNDFNKPVSIFIVDLVGKVVYQTEIDSPEREQKWQINGGDWAAGSYFMGVKADGALQYLKLVVH